MSRFSFRDIEEMADALLKKGMHPSRVRRALSEKGIRWEYQFLGQGRRERIKRLKKLGQDLCRCGQPKLLDRQMCDACLEKKWTPTSN